MEPLNTKMENLSKDLDTKLTPFNNDHLSLSLSLSLSLRVCECISVSLAFLTHTNTHAYTQSHEHIMISHTRTHAHTQTHAHAGHYYCVPNHLSWPLPSFVCFSFNTKRPGTQKFNFQERLTLIKNLLQSKIKRLHASSFFPRSTQCLFGPNGEPTQLGGCTEPRWKAKLFLILTHKFFQSKMNYLSSGTSRATKQMLAPHCLEIQFVPAEMNHRRKVCNSNSTYLKAPAYT